MRRASIIVLAVLVALAILFAYGEEKKRMVLEAPTFNVVNLCGAPQSYIDRVLKATRDAYNNYTRLFNREPPFSGTIELTNNMPPGIAGQMYIQCSLNSCYASKMALRCDLSDVEATVFHEMAHAMQAAYISPSTQYDWYIESSAEGLTVYALRRPTWLYQGYYFSKMWQTPPQELGGYSVKWYYYSAPMAWLIWQYGPGEFVQWARGNYSSYLLFLLSPWDWNKFLWAQEPEYEACGPWGGQITLKPYTGVYCRSMYNEDGTAVISDVPVNATLRPPYLLLAFSAPTAASGQFTVTPIPPKTVTTTVTQTVTYTVTVTVTQPVTTTVTVPITTTVTQVVPTTTTVTVPITTTVMTTVPTIYATTVTVTQPPLGGADVGSPAIILAIAVAMIIAAIIICSRCRQAPSQG